MRDDVNPLGVQKILAVVISDSEHKYKQHKCIWLQLSVQQQGGIWGCKSIAEMFCLCTSPSVQLSNLVK
jgi:hypothetical protein